MEDGARLKLIILGLVLAAIAGAYLFFSGRFASRTSDQTQVSEASVAPQQTVPPMVINPQVPPGDMVLSPIPPTNALPNSGVANLPNTGLPMELIGSLGAAGIAVGYALKRFPR